ncbi:MBL fold metallo-hydrolase [Mannheimia sp. E30BD]|uniref:MBL fold metallo-hydrolase n=1 Tax=Mannheimia sp. E30BD TaxID=3278708 RepID=UPI00359EF6BC
MKLKATLASLTLSSMLISTANAEISYQHIRNATAKITYGDATFLVDPYLAEKGRYAGFAGTKNSEQRNPLIELAEPVESILKDIDAVIVTHTHDDHWDEVAQKLIDKNLPIFVQDAMYSNPALAELLGNAMGVVFKSENEKTLYIVGDTIWNEQVETALNQHKPEVIVMNMGHAELADSSNSIIMGTNDVAKMAEVMPNASIITVHMDTVNHGKTSKADMRAFISGKAFEKRVAVPNESEVLKY